ncbi:MAG: Anticodon binding domain, partial [Chloroflexota bacterium]
ADRRGIAYAVVQGPDEVTAGEVVVRDLKEGTQYRFTIDTLAAGLQQLVNKQA